MSIAHRIAICSFAVSLLPAAAFAQDSEHQWDKSYAVSAKPSLSVETADSNLEIRSCGDCRAVRIHIESGRKLSEYRIEESQSGDHITFSLKDRSHIGIHVVWGREDHSPHVTVDTPTTVTLEARTSDGNLSIRDLHGELQVRTGDGNADIANIDGSLKLTSGDGNVEIRNASGTLEARASDGRMTIDGHFTAVQLHTSDGNLDFSLADGSQLSAASRIESSDGQVRIRVPSTFAADLDVTSSDGHIDCSLPLVMDHYNSENDGGSHHIHGRLNAGGVPLTIHTSDGNVTISHL